MANFITGPASAAPILEDDQVRIFKVEHEGYVLTPGLLKLERIEIDGIDLPLEQDRPLQKQDPGKEPETVMVPMAMVGVEDRPGVGTVLVRGICSNNGLWQKGSQLVVWGEWGDPVEPETPAKKAKDEKKKAAEEEAAKKKAEAEAAKKAEDEKKK